ncbi:hypothetical protein [Rhizobium sp. EC-SD404]|uniref:hypothetical protein n=1 Tax=Rhizobium sp. EC-SD404 TaxID=2038389 RepID=UPI0012524AFC|nr:hypothetical protein [Rhizobium sp. EC-SD404]VVS99833.1 conserved hypothetical protein [Rhizobium sp. EC-SD404]
MRDDDKERRQAKRDLDRLGNEGGIFGSPAMRSKARSVRDHFAAGDADQNDPIEVAATRTGRILALLAFVLLALWLFSAYA